VTEPLSHAARRPKPALSCVACEGRPSPSNSPCHVCGQSAQPEPQGPTDAASRIAHYLEQRRLIRGLDPEVISALHAGTDEPRQAALTVSDLEALARWGRPAIEPQADGEVAELVAWLRYNADYALQKAATATFKRFHRAADLLERLAQSEPQGPSRPAIEPVP